MKRQDHGVQLMREFTHLLLDSDRALCLRDYSRRDPNLYYLYSDMIVYCKYSHGPVLRREPLRTTDTFELELSQ